MKKLIVLACLVLLSSCGNDKPRPNFRRETPTTMVKCDSYGGACKLHIYEQDGVECAVYQAGGPNSARMWCRDMEPASEGPAQ